MGGDREYDRYFGGGSSITSSSSTNVVINSTCDCGLKPILLTSSTKRNLGRKFLRCPKYKMKNERCDYFLWVDCENCNRLGMLVKLLWGCLCFHGFCSVSLFLSM